MVASSGNEGGTSVLSLAQACAIYVFDLGPNPRVAEAAQAFQVLADAFESRQVQPFRKRLG